MTFVHIEGMDLAGKTTAVKNLMNLLGCDTQLRRNTLLEHSKFHQIVDKLRIAGTVKSRDLGYLYVKVLEDDLRNFQLPEKNAVQDSTILIRSLAYHQAKGNEEVVQELLHLENLHPRFDRSIVLTASIEARLGRLEERKKNQPEEVADDDLLIIKNPQLFQKMEILLINYSKQFFDSKIIDTSELSKAEVIEAISQIVFE